MKRYWVDYSGYVQGVGFRWFVSQNARRLGLTGFVRNLDNGHVQVEVQGAPEAIDHFLARLQVGNGYSQITHTDIREIDVRTGEREFTVAF